MDLAALKQGMMFLPRSQVRVIAGGGEVWSGSCFSLICVECLKQSAPLMHCISKATSPFCGFYVSVA